MAEPVSGFFVGSADGYLLSAVVEHLGAHQATQSGFCLRVTLDESAARKPWVTKLLAKAKPRLLRNYMQRSQYVFVDLVCSKGRAREVDDVCEALLARKEGGEVIKVIVLSTLRSAAGISPAAPSTGEGLSTKEQSAEPDEDEEEVSPRSSDSPPREKSSAGGESPADDPPTALSFSQRARVPQLEELQALEDRLVQLAERRQDVEVFLFQIGAVYGQGERDLKGYFEAAWKQQHLAAASGPELLHLVERKAFVTLLFQCLETPDQFQQRVPLRPQQPPEGVPPAAFRLFWVSETAPITHAELLACIGREAGTGVVTADGLLPECLQFPALRGINAEVAAFLSQQRSAFSKRIVETTEEYCAHMNIRPLRMAIVGGSAALCEALGGEYQIQGIDAYAFLPSLLSSAVFAEAAPDFSDEERRWLADRVFSEQVRPAELLLKMDDPRRQFYVSLLRLRLSMSDSLYRGYLLFNAAELLQSAAFASLFAAPSPEPQPGAEAASAGEMPSEEPSEGKDSSAVRLRSAAPDFCLLFGSETNAHTALLAYARSRNLSYLRCCEPLDDSQTVRALQLVRIHIEREGRPFNFLMEEGKVNQQAWDLLVQRQLSALAAAQETAEREETAAQAAGSSLRARGFAQLRGCVEAELRAEEEDLKQYASTRMFLTRCFYEPVKAALEEARLCAPSDPYHFVVV